MEISIDTLIANGITIAIFLITSYFTIKTAGKNATKEKVENGKDITAEIRESIDYHESHCSHLPEFAALGSKVESLEGLIVGGFNRIDKRLNEMENKKK